MKQKICVAVGQFAPLLMNVPENIKASCRLAAAAAEQGARLILLPEGCLTGNAISGPEKQAALEMNSGVFRELQETADSSGIVICAGFATVAGDKFNIVQAVVRPGAGILYQRKSTRASTEPEFLMAWPDYGRVVFAVDGVNIAMKICSEGSSTKVAEAIRACGAGIVLYPSAGCIKASEVIGDDADPALVAEARKEFETGLARSAELVHSSGIPHLIANPVGFDGETWWPGNSFIIDGEGVVRGVLPGEKRAACMKPAFVTGEVEADRP